MHTQRYLYAALTTAALSAAAAAADPVVVELADRAAARTAVVTVGDVARVTGGDAAARDQVVRLDLAELKLRDPGVTITRRVVEFRLQLAGIDPGAARVTGADRVTVTAARRTVTADEVVAAARAEVLRRLSGPPDAVAVELIQPVVVALPDVPEGEQVTITALPHGRAAVGSGRVQMDMTISARGEKLLGLPVYLEVRAAGPRPAGPGYPGAGAAGVVPAGGVLPPPPGVAPAGGTLPPPLTPGARPPAPAEVLIRPRQRAKMVVRLGAVEVTAVGEAQQEGRLGQSILLQNVDSKKMVTGRVVGPAVVEVDLGGTP